MCRFVGGVVTSLDDDCRQLYEHKLSERIQECHSSAEKLKCLQNVISKFQSWNDSLCKETSANSDGIKRILSLITEYKKEFSRKVAAEINKYLKQGGLQIEVGNDLVVRILASDNETLDLSFKFNKNNTEVSERKMKMSTNNVLAMLFAPAMFIAGWMPWILPGIKMAVMFVTMMNNMAFSSALFALIRGYIFDTRPDDHIIYVNNGYKNSDHNHGNVPQKIYLHSNFR